MPLDYPSPAIAIRYYGQMVREVCGDFRVIPQSNIGEHLDFFGPITNIYAFLDGFRTVAKIIKWRWLSDSEDVAWTIEYDKKYEMPAHKYIVYYNGPEAHIENDQIKWSDGSDRQNRSLEFSAKLTRISYLLEAILADADIIHITIKDY